MINWKDDQALKRAKIALKNKGVIIYPTDTIYGFGGDATLYQAVNKINTIKGRSSPMSVLAPNIKTALSWMNIHPDSLDDISNVLGGKTTIIVPVNDGIVHSSILGEGSTLGIRIPDHPFCHQLSNEYPNPIITTSVNRTGQLPKTTPRDINLEFGDEIDLLIENGIIEGTASTIYKYEDGRLIILRS